MEKRRSCIVVGGAGGIGEAICRRLAGDGLRVIVADINIDGANRVSAELDGEGHQSKHIDVTDEGSVELLFDEIEAEEPAEILVVVAGGPLADPYNPPTIASMTTEEWNRTLVFNVTGTFNCVRKFAAQRLARPLDHMRIVTFGSITGQLGGSPTGVAYATSKAAIAGFVRQVAHELAGAGITVNSVAPGPVETAEFLRLTTDSYRQSIRDMVPLSRIGSPEEIAHCVAFLVSRDAAFVTGTTVDVNGGLNMR